MGDFCRFHVNLPGWALPWRKRHKFAPERSVDHLPTIRFQVRKCVREGNRMVKPKNYPDVMFLREIDIQKNREYLGKSKWFLTQLPGLLFPWDYHKGFFHQTSGLFPDSSPPSFNCDPAGIVGWRGTIFPNKQISMFTNLFKRKFGGRGPSQMCVLQIIISYGTKQWSRICRPWQQHSHRIHVWYIYMPPFGWLW